MITKAFIEEIISPYEVKVRIPVLDRVTSSSLSTSKENLNVATICSLPNCYINPQVGDVVFVGFEDNTYYKAVILGHLSRQSMTNTYPDMNIRNLEVIASAKLGSDTSIGEVTPSNIQHLKNTKDNLQRQIDNLSERLEKIETMLNQI